MSDEKVVPTAAEVGINYQNGDIRLHSILKGMLEEGDELVRRSDVEKLIENKIEDETHNVSKLKGKWQLVLEELLEEIQK